MPPKPSLTSFLAARKVLKGQAFTHTSIGTPKASYYISDADAPTLLSLYTSSILAGGKPTLTERHTDDGPVLVDLDFRQPSEARLYDADWLSAFVTALSALVREHVATDTFTVYVLEKGPCGRSDPKCGLYKDGIHLIIPDVITVPAVQLAIRDAFLARHSSLFTPWSNASSAIYDEAVIARNNWLMYGSRKPGEAHAWTYTHRYLVADGAIARDDTPLPPEELIPLFSIRNKGLPHELRGPGNDAIQQQRGGRACGGSAPTPPLRSVLPAPSTRFKTNVPFDLLQRAVLALPDTFYGPGTYTAWSRTIWAILHTAAAHGYPDKGEALCHEFSRQCASGYDPRAVDAVIRGYRPDHANPATIRGLLFSSLRDNTPEDVHAPILEEARALDRVALLQNIGATKASVATKKAAVTLLSSPPIAQTAEAVAKLLDQVPEDDALELMHLHFSAGESLRTAQLRRLLTEAARAVDPGLSFTGWEPGSYGTIALFGPCRALMDDRTQLVVDGTVVGSLATARAADMARHFLEKSARKQDVPKEPVMMALANLVFPGDRFIPPVAEAHFDPRMWLNAQDRDSRCTYDLVTLENLLSPEELAAHRNRYSRLAPPAPPPSLHDPATTWDDVRSDPELRPYDPSHSFQVVRAGMGLGKTKAAVEYIGSLPPDKSILIITYSIALSNKNRAEFVEHGFTSYLDSMQYTLDGPRLIVCLDSICRVDRNTFDLVLLDEALSLLQHLHSPHMKRREAVCAKLNTVLTQARQLLVMDAAADNLLVRRFVNQLHHQRKDEEKPHWVLYTHVRNRGSESCHIVYSQHGHTSKNRGLFEEAFMQRLEALLKDGKRVVVACSSRTMVKKIGERVGKAYPTMLYTKDTDPAVLRDHLRDVNTAWKAYQLVVYSPTITAGISFEDEHFDCRMAFFENSMRTAPVDVCLQQLYRVRTVRDNETFIYVSLPATYSMPCHPWEVEALLDKFDTYLSRLDMVFAGTSRHFKDGRFVLNRDNIFYEVLVGSTVNRHLSLNYFKEILEDTLRNDRGVKLTTAEFDGQKAEEEAQTEKKSKEARVITTYTVPSVEEADALKQARVSRPLTAEECQLLHNFRVARMYGISTDKVDKHFIDTYVGPAPSQEAKDTYNRFMMFALIYNGADARQLARCLMLNLGFHRDSDGSHILSFAGTAKGGIHHRTIVFVEGVRLLTTLFPDTPPAKLFEPEAHAFTMDNALVCERVDAYINELNPPAYKAMLSLFGIEARRHQLPLTERKKYELAKKVLTDAFGLTCCAKNVFTASATEFFQLVKKYEPANMYNACIIDDIDDV